MTHATPRQRRRAANLERILDTAMRMVVDVGFDGLSVNKLAKEVDYTPGALYRYFSSKDALMIALVARAIRDFHQEVSGNLASDLDPIQRIRAFALAFKDVALARPNRFGMVAMMMAHPRILVEDRVEAEPAMDALTEALQPLALAFAEAQAKGLIDEGDPILRALTMFSGIQGVLQLRKQARFSPGLLDLDRMSTEMVHTLLRGWGAKGDFS